MDILPFEYTKKVIIPHNRTKINIIFFASFASPPYILWNITVCM